MSTNFTNGPASIHFHSTKLLYTARGPQKLNAAFDIKQNNILAITGPSLAGKTTLLRILAGLTSVDSGYIGRNLEVLNAHCVMDLCS